MNTMIIYGEEDLWRRVAVFDVSGDYLTVGGVLLGTRQPLDGDLQLKNQRQTPKFM
jgi:hypothetical protein